MRKMQALDSWIGLEYFRRPWRAGSSATATQARSHCCLGTHASSAPIRWSVMLTAVERVWSINSCGRKACRQCLDRWSRCAPGSSRSACRTRAPCPRRTLWCSANLRMCEAHRGQSGRLDRRHVPAAAALDAEHLGLLAEQVVAVVRPEASPPPCNTRRVAAQQPRGYANARSGPTALLP